MRIAPVYRINKLFFLSMIRSIENFTASRVKTSCLLRHQRRVYLLYFLLIVVNVEMTNVCHDADAYANADANGRISNRNSILTWQTIKRNSFGQRLVRTDATSTPALLAFQRTALFLGVDVNRLRLLHDDGIGFSANRKSSAMRSSSEVMERNGCFVLRTTSVECNAIHMEKPMNHGRRRSERTRSHRAGITKTTLVDQCFFKECCKSIKETGRNFDQQRGAFGHRHRRRRRRRRKETKSLHLRDECIHTTRDRSQKTKGSRTSDYETKPMPAHRQHLRHLSIFCETSDETTTEQRRDTYVSIRERKVIQLSLTRLGPDHPAHFRIPAGNLDSQSNGQLATTQT
ncbi:uncharacterized protein LOC128880075 [Hylaeus volcanicus]|uniref:uncharacterized protein LOC128880075 n=1 Tax=Hylaeus volcanicus TaxID=313075 RepID=UPI0023B7B9F5|nr:uncharacterized protein LOC128880075 [Hylaeus volcanicus]